MLSCHQKKMLQVLFLLAYFFPFLAIPTPPPPTPWHPSPEYSLGRSPHLDQILFLPLLHDVTWSKCLNLSEPWLLNFCIAMLNNIHWTRLWGRRFSDHHLWKHSPDWPSRTQCRLYLRFSNKEINCLLRMTTGPSSDSWALRIKDKIPRRAAPQTFKSNHLLPQILPLLSALWSFDFSYDKFWSLCHLTNFSTNSFRLVYVFSCDRRSCLIYWKMNTSSNGTLVPR